MLLSDIGTSGTSPVHGGQAVNLTVNGKKDRIRYRTRYRLDPEEKGVDLAAPVYVRAYGEWTKKTGIGRIESGKPGVKTLAWDDAGFSGLIKAKKSDVYFFTRETYNDAPDYHVADASSPTARRLPQQTHSRRTSSGRRASS